MRTIKKPEERKNEILDVAEKLFITKGYTKTTIIDILEEIGIAKGTFYYYFKSKEEVMDAIIDRIVKADAMRSMEIAANPNIPVTDKIFQILLAQKPGDENDNKKELVEQFHQPNNAEMHQKSLVQSILHSAPILAEVVNQGVSEGIFTTKYPRETVEFLLISGEMIFDEGLFQWNPLEIQRRVEAFLVIMETSLGAKKGSFDYISKILL